MEFETRHIGANGGKPPSMIELTVKGVNVFFTEDIVDFKTNKVDESLITELNRLANELIEHNQLVDEYYNE